MLFLFETNILFNKITKKYLFFRCDITTIKSDTPSVPVAELLKVLPDHDALLGLVHIDAKFLDAAGKIIINYLYIKLIL